LPPLSIDRELSILNSSIEKYLPRFPNIKQQIFEQHELKFIAAKLMKFWVFKYLFEFDNQANMKE
jgi:hypothetical protein